MKRIIRMTLISIYLGISAGIGTYMIGTVAIDYAYNYINQSAHAIAVNFGYERPSEPMADLSIYEVIVSEAESHGISADLVSALISVESNFNPSAISNKGAFGLMQLTIPTAKTVCDIDDPALLLNPKINIQCGTKILNLHLTERQNTINALREFNGGISCMKSKRCSESEAYWQKVLTRVGFGKQLIPESFYP